MYHYPSNLRTSSRPIRSTNAQLGVTNAWHCVIIKNG